MKARVTTLSFMYFSMIMNEISYELTVYSNLSVHPFDVQQICLKKNPGPFQNFNLLEKSPSEGHKFKVKLLRVLKGFLLEKNMKNLYHISWLTVHGGNFKDLIF